MALPAVKIRGLSSASPVLVIVQGLPSARMRWRATAGFATVQILWYNS
jgi:hypothetical protein